MFYYSLKKTFIFSKDVNYFLRLIVDAVIYCKLVNYTKSTAQLFLFYNANMFSNPHYIVQCIILEKPFQNIKRIRKCSSLPFKGMQMHSGILFHSTSSEKQLFETIEIFVYLKSYLCIYRETFEFIYKELG